MFAILRYYQSKADSCVQSHLINGKFTLMSTHTDDVFGVSTTEDSATEPKTELDRCFEIKDLETLSIILGMKIFQDSVTQLDRYRSHRRHTSSEGWNASEWPTATPNQPHYPRTLTSAITYIPRLRITGYSWLTSLTVPHLEALYGSKLRHALTCLILSTSVYRSGQVRSFAQIGHDCNWSNDCWLQKAMTVTATGHDWSTLWLIVTGLVATSCDQSFDSKYNSHQNEP